LPKAFFFILTIVLLVACTLPVEGVTSGVIQNDSSYMDTFGHYHVVGEVRNTGSVWFQSILISVMLKDKTGALVDTRQGSPWLQHLPPQAAIGFDVTEPDTGKSDMIRSYTIALTFQSGQSRTASLEISGLDTSRNSVGWLQVQGVVLNSGASESDNTNVTGTFYGSDGKVVFVTFTTPTASTIQPGTNQPFTLTIVDSARSRLVTRFSVAAESNEYTSVLTYTNIPEFPWQSTIMTWFALAAVLVVVRKRRRTKNPDQLLLFQYRFEK
jgi:hypothetical protein